MQLKEFRRVHSLSLSHYLPIYLVVSLTHTLSLSLSLTYLISLSLILMYSLSLSLIPHNIIHSHKYNIQTALTF